MKRLLPLLTLTLLLSACTFGVLHPTLYNNKVVDLIMPATLAVEDSAVTYNSTIPDDINENSEIDTTQLRDDFDETETLLNDVNKALSYESENLEQQATVRGHLETYLSAGNAYLDAYQNTLVFFEEAQYQTDPNEVDNLDPALHAAYNTFTEANNDLVTSLASFVEVEESTE
jgi:hypothetical protein